MTLKASIVYCFQTTNAKYSNFIKWKSLGLQAAQTEYWKVSFQREPASYALEITHRILRQMETAEWNIRSYRCAQTKKCSFMYNSTRQTRDSIYLGDKFCIHTFH